MEMISHAVVLYHIGHRRTENVTKGLEIDCTAMLDLCNVSPYVERRTLSRDKSMI